MATGIDSSTDRADARLATPPQGAIDEVHRLRAAATVADPTRATVPPGQDLAFGDFEKLYGKGAVIGGAAPAQAVRPDAPGHVVPVKAGDRQPAQARTGDGHQPTDAPVQPAGREPTNAEARESLLKAARDKYKDDPKALAAFQQDMDAFEKRMGKWPTKSAEIGQTYQQIERMLNGHSMALPDKDTKKIAAEVMHQAASPRINQGNSQDCLAGSLETRLYTRAPAQAAKLMADMVLTGAYETTDHRTIRLDAETMNSYQLPVSMSGQEERTHASKIMQATLRNIDLDKINQDTGSDFHYVVHADNKTLQALKIAGNGEHVIDYSKKPPEDVSGQHLGMRNGFAEEVYQSVAGTNDGGFTLNFYTQANKDEFKRTLDEMARNGKFPATIGVNLLQEPFETQGGGKNAAEAVTIMTNGLPLHAITITGYDPKTGQIEYTNHLSGSQTRTISRDDMFRAMHQPDIDGFADDLGAKLAELNKKDPSVLRDLPKGLFQVLTMVEPSGRDHVVNTLSQKLGVDVKAMMTPEERERLGLREDGVIGFIKRQFE